MKQGDFAKTEVGRDNAMCLALGGGETPSRARMLTSSYGSASVTSLGMLFSGSICPLKIAEERIKFEMTPILRGGYPQMCP